jgi:drug/metabolite transporter (DMT)-like permease
MQKKVPCRRFRADRSETLGSGAKLGYLGRMHDNPGGIPVVGASRRAEPLTGVLLMLLAMAILPAMDGMAKYLTARYPPLEIVWARYFFHLVILLPIVLMRHGPRSLLPPRAGLQLLRGGLVLASTVLYFSALALMPIVDALSLVFVAPLVVTAVAPMALGEHVGVRRWAAVIVGFAGALIIIRPGIGVFQWGAVLAISAGVSHGLYFIVTRKLARSAPPLVTLTYAALLGAVAMSAVVPFVWVTPGPADLALMFGVGAVAAVGHFLVIKAFDYASASLLAPYAYAEIVGATAIGLVVFGDFPDAWTWTGIAVIAASGIYISFRERRVSEA